jgi:large subunit ribosomal protein L9
MKVLLTQDVYKLGRAGDVKKVANGYGRNYLIPQGLAILATPGALKQAERIRVQADAQRAVLNQEMSGIAEQLVDLTLYFPAKAGETGKLYGSVTQQMIADAIQEERGVEINRRQMDFQPLRTLGTHEVQIRLTVDLVPEITVVIHREGEAPTAPGEEAEIAEEVEGDATAEEAVEPIAEAVEDSEPVAETAEEEPQSEAESA